MRSWTDRSEPGRMQPPCQPAGVVSTDPEPRGRSLAGSRMSMSRRPGPGQHNKYLVGTSSDGPVRVGRRGLPPALDGGHTTAQIAEESACRSRINSRRACSTDEQVQGCSTAAIFADSRNGPTEGGRSNPPAPGSDHGRPSPTHRARDRANRGAWGWCPSGNAAADELASGGARKDGTQSKPSRGT